MGTVADGVRAFSAVQKIQSPLLDAAGAATIAPPRGDYRGDPQLPWGERIQEGKTTGSDTL